MQFTEALRVFALPSPLHFHYKFIHIDKTLGKKEIVQLVVLGVMTCMFINVDMFRGVEVGRDSEKHWTELG